MTTQWSRSRSRSPRVALATVVTARALSEFLIAKRSLELFHGPESQWFIRCDEPTRAALADFPNVHAIVSAEENADPGEPLSKRSWRVLMAEKMNAIEDAWQAGSWEAVAYIDSDIIVMAPFLDEALSLGGQVVLSPHFSLADGKSQPLRSGDYNGGFVLMRDRTFHRWWHTAAAAERSHMADQTCLNRAGEAFDVKELDERANVGWWRGTSLWDAPAVPADCRFCHVHLFQDAHADYELSQKTFALNCVEFLINSSLPEHRLLAEEIFALDPTDYYRTMLRRRIAVLTMCEPERAVRLLLMARTLPRHSEVLCVCKGSREALLRRLDGAPLPPHLRVLTVEDAPDRRAWLARSERRAELAFLADIDFVFPLGFWHKLTAAHHAAGANGDVTCPVPLGDPDGRFLWYQFWHRYHGASAPTVPLRDGERSCVASPMPEDIVRSETPATHYLPLTAKDVACAAPVFANAPRSLQDVHAGVAACRELSAPDGERTIRPWPGGLMPAADFLSHRRPDRIQVAANTFVFHLWHPADRESAYAGWYAHE